MSDPHADRRDKKYKKKRYGMQESNRSIKTVILRIIGEKANDTKRKN